MPFKDSHNLFDSNDPLISKLLPVIRFSIRMLAVLMTLVIVWGVIDVIYIIYVRLITPPVYLLNINDIFATFGAFMAVLIAIEIFANITMYLERNIIHLKLVVATALMAAARKVIVMDFKELDAIYIFALALVNGALGVTYWLITRDNSGGETVTAHAGCDTRGEVACAEEKEGTEE